MVTKITGNVVPFDPARRAKHAEIARRYDSRGRERAPYDRIEHKIAVLRKLARRRHREGRDDVDFDALEERVRADPRAWSGRRIGREIKLTFAEQLWLGGRGRNGARLANAVRCADITETEYARRRRQLRRQQDRSRKARSPRRPALAPTPSSPPDPQAFRDRLWENIKSPEPDRHLERAAAVDMALAPEWQTVREIAAKVGTWPVFRGLGRSSLRVAVWQAVRILKANGMAEIETRTGPRGLKVLYARSADR
jgi:hypothetical protein